jgi:Periplasmic copper-binding protein (NosD)
VGTFDPMPADGVVGWGPWQRGVAASLDARAPVSIVDLGASTGGTAAANTAALNAALSTGQPVLIPAGTFTVNAFTVPHGAVLLGVNSGTYNGTYTTQASCLRLAAGQNTNLLTVPTGSNRVLIRDLQLDGNKAGQTTGGGAGIRWADDVAQNEAQAVIERVYVHDCRGSGLHVGPWRQAIHLNDVVSNFNLEHGFRIAGTDCVLTGVIAGDNTLDGVSVEADATTVTGGALYNNRVGVNVGAKRAVVQGNGIDKNLRQGIYVGAGAGASIVGNQFVGNGRSADNTYPHIQVASTTGQTSILGNGFWARPGDVTNDTNWAVQLDPGARVHHEGSTFEAGASQQGLTSGVEAVLRPTLTAGSGGDDTAELQALATAAVTSGAVVELDGTRNYQISAALDLRGDGLIWNGNGATITQNTANTPVLLAGGEQQHLSGLHLDHGAFPSSTDTNAYGMLLYNVFMSTFRDIKIDRSGTGIGIAQAGGFPSGATTNTCFSSTFADIRVNGYSVQAMDMRTFPAGGASSTGCVFSNVYIHNNYAGTTTSAGTPVVFRDWDECVFHQLNIEWVILTNKEAFFMQRFQNPVFSGLHFEGCTLNGNNALIRAYENCRLTVQGMTVVSPTITNDAGQKSLFRLNQNSGSPMSLDLNGVRIKNVTNTGARPFALAEIEAGSTLARVEIKNADTAGLTGSTTVDATGVTPSQVVRVNDTWLVATGTAGAPTQASILVASSNAPAAVKAIADFVCDGTDDQVQINAAIDLAAPLNANNALMPAGAQQRGCVELSGGRFNVSGSVVLRTAVWLKGQGTLTEVRAVGAGASHMFTLGRPDDHLVRISDLYCHGNGTTGAQTGNCIDFDMTNSNANVSPFFAAGTGGYPDVNPDSDHQISNLYIDQFTGGARTAIKLYASAGTANNRGNIIDSIQIRDCSGNGIWLSSASDSFISNTHIGGCGDTGHRIEGGNNKLSNVKSFFCDVAGFIFGSSRCYAVGLESQDNFDGVIITGQSFVGSGWLVDNSSNAGITLGINGIQLSGVQIVCRTGGRYTTQATGIDLASRTELGLTSFRIDPANITTPIAGTAGARSFVRIPNGTTLLAVG